MMTDPDRRAVHEVALVAEREHVGWEEALRRYQSRASVDSRRRYAAARIEESSRAKWRPQHVNHGPRLLTTTGTPPGPMPMPPAATDRDVPRGREADAFLGV